MNNELRKLLIDRNWPDSEKGKRKHKKKLQKERKSFIYDEGFSGNRKETNIEL